MLTSITPLGERGRGQRWAVTVTAFVLGSVLGGVLAGAALGGLGGLLDAPARAALLVGAGVCALAAASDAPRPAWRLPTGRRQVDEDWLTRYRGWVYGAGFGLQLGLAVVTIVTSAATYAALALALLVGGALPGAAVGAVFGLVRALPVLGLRRVDSPERLRAAARRLEHRARPAHGATVGVLLAAGAALLTGAVLA